MTNAFVEYFRCGNLADFEITGELSQEAGFFTFGGATCYGRPAGALASKDPRSALPDVSQAVSCKDGHLRLPFDLTEVVANLRQERYARSHRPHLERITAASVPRTLYYLLRPALPVHVRRYLQRVSLAGWGGIAFPQWPVDTTVEKLMRHTMALTLRSRGLERMPFIWFWPDGAAACALMTHDVEGVPGQEFCGQLMDLDERYGVESAFQVIPEMRGGTPRKLLREIRTRGFEANLHDLNHDGYLFQSRERFLERAARINRYARDFDCRGFRAGAMYREQHWYDAFEFSYDMSVPNVAHLEPQRGGCCTVMPYYVGRILELPLTTVQDYTLFHILGDYSIALWRQQCEQILAQNGLITFITHPDYLIEARARAVYLDLLAYLSELRCERNVWITVPGEVDRWWRRRSQMRLVTDGNTWHIEGPESGRARVAYAVLQGDELVYQLDEQMPVPAHATPCGMSRSFTNRGTREGARR